MAVDGLVRRASAFCIRSSVFSTREGIVRPVRVVAKDVGFSNDFRLADPALEARRPPLREVLNSDSWSDLLTENSKISEVPSEDLLKALSSSVKYQDVPYRMVDGLMERLVDEGHFEFAVELLERCSELLIIRDASLANFLKLCYETGRVDVMVNAALHWIRSEENKTVFYDQRGCVQDCQFQVDPKQSVYTQLVWLKTEGLTVTLVCIVGEREFRGYAANSVTYRAFLAGDVDICVYLLRTMHDYKIPFESDYPYSITIHACNSHRRWDSALEIYDLFKESGLRHSHIIIRNVLYTVREGNMQWKFEEMLDGWIYRRRLHFQEFRAMMETCKHFGDLDRAKAVFKQVRRQRVNLDIRGINTLLSIYKDLSMLPPMDDVFSFMERSGLRPDVFTFSLLFGCCFKTYQPIEVVDRVVEQVNQWNVKFNAVMLSSACVAYTRADIDPTDLRVSRAASLLQSTNVADQDCYHAVISACAELGHLKEALKLQERMEEAGYPSNEATYQILSQRCLNAGFTDYALSFKDQWEAYVETIMPTDTETV